MGAGKPHNIIYEDAHEKAEMHAHTAHGHTHQAMHYATILLGELAAADEQVDRLNDYELVAACVSHGRRRRTVLIATWAFYSRERCTQTVVHAAAGSAS